MDQEFGAEAGAQERRKKGRAAKSERVTFDLGEHRLAPCFYSRRCFFWVSGWLWRRRDAESSILGGFDLQV